MDASSVFPHCASDVGLGSGVDLCAFSVYHCVALVAFLTDSLLGVELLAGALDFAADTFAIEVVSIRALEAGVSAPNLAAEVVIELGQKCSVIELLVSELDLGHEWCH